MTNMGDCWSCAAPLIFIGKAKNNYALPILKAAPPGNVPGSCHAIHKKMHPWMIDVMGQLRPGGDQQAGEDQQQGGGHA